LFGAVHLDAIGLVYTVPAGVLFAWLYVRSNSLYVAIAAHVAANVTVVVLDYAVF
jgi:membrane protease YdiL (CAAX protease family)